MTFLTVPKAAKELGISEYALRQMLRDNKLPVYRFGNRYYVNIPSVKKLFEIPDDEGAQNDEH